MSNVSWELICFHFKLNTLCAWRHNMPPPRPLYARCGPPPVHSLHALLSAPCSMNIYDRQAAARSGRWRRNWSRQYTLCSDLNSQPKRPGTLTFDLLTLKVLSESRVTWATSVPILVFLGLSVLDLGPMYATDLRQTHVRRQTSDKSIP